ncbi:MAG: transposase [Candidatus Buchananbacteria bacterium]
MLHRNSQKRIYFPGAVYFITIVVQARLPFFKEEIFCDLLIEDLKFCKELKKFELYGFVILPDHIHLLIKPGYKFNISKIIQSIKKEFSRDINRILNCEGAIPESRLRGHQYSHYYNKNFSVPNFFKYKSQFIKKYRQNQFQFSEFRWQKSFHDHLIRHEKDLNYHLRYIWLNPQKHKIVNNFEKYKYFSYNNLPGFN